MLLHRGSYVGILALASVFTACKNGKDSVGMGPQEAELRTNTTLAAATAPPTKSTLLARSTFSDPNDQNLNVKRISDDWHVDIKAKPAMDIAVQSISFPVGSSSTWHTHPGPVFIQVAQGTMTFYMSDDPTCTPMVRTKGQGFLDLGDHAHIARNEGTEDAINIVTYFAPPGAALRTDQPNPGNCPF
jgi:hypothetical protein